MPDFDFEELDRAIAGSASSQPQPGFDASKQGMKPSVPPALRRSGAAGMHDAPDDMERRARRSPRPVMDITPTLQRKVKPEAKSAEKAPDLAKRLVPRRPGRSMDFIGPSRSPAVNKTARVNKTDVAEDALVNEITKNEPQSLGRSKPKARAAEAKLAKEPKLASEPRAKKLSRHMPMDEELLDDDASWNAPLESPFLPDAKVEKRPLGRPGPLPPVFASGPKPFSSEVKYASTPADFMGSDLELDNPMRVPDFEAELPSPNDAAKFFGYTPETQPTEPRESLNIPTLSKEPVEPVGADEPEEPLLLEEPEDFFLEPTAGPSNGLDESNVTQGSIRQQYTEQPRDDEESGDIYDTESYHQPISVPAKKSSAWKVIIWILLLAAVGTGVGVAFYIYVLPML